MSTQLSKGPDVPPPDVSIFDSDKPILQRLKDLRDEFGEFFEHIKFAILIPFSWFLTTFKFIRVLIWRFCTLPLRLFINFYERRVRGVIPWLPSIWGTLFILFPNGIKFPTFTSLTAGPFKGAGPIGKNPTLDINIDEILNSNQSNGQSGTNGAGESLVGNGSASSQVNTNRSELETALKKLPTLSPGDLDAGLNQVKAAQAEAEKSLKLTDSA